MPTHAPMIIFVPKAQLYSLKKIDPSLEPSLTHSIYTAMPLTCPADVKNKNDFVQTSAINVTSCSPDQFAEKLRTNFNPLSELVRMPVM